MSFLQQSNSSDQAPNYIGIPVQSSVSTLPKPIVWGVNITGPNLVYYGDFTKTGSGGGKGGGGKDGSTSYSASIEMGICEGPIAGIHSVIVDQGVNNLASLSLSLIDGSMPQSPWGYLSSAHPGNALGYQGTALIVGEHYSLGSSPTLPNHQIAVIGLRAGTASWANASAFAPADLALVIEDFLTSPQFGVPLFPSASINMATLLSSGSGIDASLQTYCRALGMGFSPALTSTESAKSILERWLQLANVAAVWSGTRLKFIPYGDQPVTGNGVTYQPDLTPIYDLDDDDFIGDASEDPVTISRTAPEDLYQVVRCEVTTNDGYFSYVPVEARDQAAIETVGGTPRIMPTISAHEIVSAYLGGISAQLILQRQLYVRNTYSFQLGPEFSALEPMDLVTLTDPVLGLDMTVVRVTQVEENDDATLSFTAEEFPQGIATATAYVKQEAAANVPNPVATPDAVNPPVIFEPTSVLLASGNIAAPQIWVAASGGSAGAVDPNWGGAQIWVSVDDVNYIHIGDVTQPARMGVLAQALPGITGYNPAIPDTGNVLEVNLSESGGSLSSGAAIDAVAGRTLCYVDGELMSYVTATLTGANQYTLSTLYRAQYGTSATAHAVGSQFTRLDGAVFQYDLPAAYAGQTLYLKLVSFNIWGQGLEDISAVTPVTYVVQGTAIDFSTSPFMSILFNGGSISLGDLAQPIAATFACGNLALAPVQNLQLGSL